MKLNFFLSETIITATLVLILIAVLNPTGLLMPMSYGTTLILALVVAFIAFSSLIWKEHSRDEREDHHRQRAGRISFFVGTSVLVLGIAVQGLPIFYHTPEVDPWLILALIAMVLSKIVSRIYSQLRH